MGVVFITLTGWLVAFSTCQPLFYILTGYTIYGNLLSFFAQMWHRAIWKGHPMRLELTRVGLLVEHANHYTTRGAFGHAIYALAQFLHLCRVVRLLQQVYMIWHKAVWTLGNVECSFITSYHIYGSHSPGTGWPTARALAWLA